MKVKYEGDVPVQLSTLGKDVNPGDEIEVPDSFHNANFTEVTPKKKEGEKKDATTK